MGGYGSGRPKMSRLTTECIAIDMMQFKDILRTPGISQGQFLVTGGSMSENCPPDKIPGLTYTIERHDEQHGRITLGYIATQGYGKERHYRPCILLESLPCQWGGVRWLMLAPCCERRARILYIGGTSVDPLCRKCQGLHYQSQRSSYVERHITYEKYLLRNYGLQWEHDTYHSLKEHYFDITPEYAYKMRMSQLEQDLHLMRLLIDFETKMLKIHLRDMASLHSDEDKHLYLEQVANECGQDYGLDLVAMLGLSIQFERAVFRSADTSILNDITDCYDSEYGAVEQESGLGDSGETSEIVPHTLKLLKSKEQDIQQEMRDLEKRAA
jgi:hypothetical protein